MAAEAGAPAAEAAPAPLPPPPEGADEAVPPAPPPRFTAVAEEADGAGGVHVTAAAGRPEPEAAPDAAAAAEAAQPQAAAPRGGRISAHFARLPPGQLPPLPAPSARAAVGGNGGARAAPAFRRDTTRHQRPAPEPLPASLRERAGALAHLSAAGAPRPRGLRCACLAAERMLLASTKHTGTSFGRARSSLPLRIGAEPPAGEPLPRFPPLSAFAFGRTAPVDVAGPAAFAAASAFGAPRAASAAPAPHRAAPAPTPTGGATGSVFRTPPRVDGSASPEDLRFGPVSGALAPAPPLSDDPARVFGALRSHYAALAARNCPGLAAALLSGDGDAADVALRRDALFAAPHASGGASDDEAAAAAAAAAQRRRQRGATAQQQRVPAPARAADSGGDTWPPRSASPPRHRAPPEACTGGFNGDDEEEQAWPAATAQAEVAALDAQFPVGPGRAPPAAWQRAEEADLLADLGLSPPAQRQSHQSMAHGAQFVSPPQQQPWMEVDDGAAARKRSRTAGAGAPGFGVGALWPRQR